MRHCEIFFILNLDICFTRGIVSNVSCPHDLRNVEANLS